MSGDEWSGQQEGQQLHTDGSPVPLLPTAGSSRRSRALMSNEQRRSNIVTILDQALAVVEAPQDHEAFAPPSSRRQQ